MFLYGLFTTISFPGFGQLVLGLSLDFHIIITYILSYYYRQYLNFLVSKMELVAVVFNDVKSVAIAIVCQVCQEIS